MEHVAYAISMKFNKSVELSRFEREYNVIDSIFQRLQSTRIKFLLFIWIFYFLKYQAVDRNRAESAENPCSVRSCFTGGCKNGLEFCLPPRGPKMEGFMWVVERILESAIPDLCLC